MKVLIAQYDANARLLLTRLLENWGFEVTATKDSAQAWQALQADDAPRLAILDWVVPKMDGVEVCRRVKARKTMQPPYIILLTAQGDKESMVIGLDAGADDYVGKPYDPAELRARLQVGRRLVELNDELLEAQGALEIQARTDPLTGVLNRGAIVEELEQEVRRAERNGAGFGLGMLDVDRFKRVNDAHGHAAGDAVLREVVRRAQDVLRPYDSFGRLGGEEFLVIVPGADEAELRQVLERARTAVGAAPVLLGELRLHVTVSLGGATLERRGVGALVGGEAAGREAVDGLMARADDALYAAKAQGRDRVVVTGACDSLEVRESRDSLEVREARDSLEVREARDALEVRERSGGDA